MVTNQISIGAHFKGVATVSLSLLTHTSWTILAASSLPFLDIFLATEYHRESVYQVLLASSLNVHDLYVKRNLSSGPEKVIPKLASPKLASKGAFCLFEAGVSMWRTCYQFTFPLKDRVKVYLDSPNIEHPKLHYMAASLPLHSKKLPCEEF
ncbi:hypothetical protein L2E82_15887 [Cichorium intybus]|uniref:Uncharacterized protein n=1 Tax=Cichorium intybus TaxID=13427 RepID=A0ACB9F4I2_CICIN|nr:hypothetical protein L2E82_15887 [Cichorium intybus]